MQKTLFYDLQVFACTALFVVDAYVCVFCEPSSGPWLGPAVHTALLVWVICVAYRVAKSAVKLRIQGFLVFGLIVTVACICYFAVLYRYAVAIDGPTSLVSPNGLPLESLPYASGHYTLYFSVTTFFSVGNGDLQPQTPLMMLITSLEALTGYAMTVLLITAGLERIRGMRWGSRWTRRR